MKRLRHILLAGIMLASPVAASTSSPFTIPDEAAFFAALDLDRPELAPLRTAVLAADWPRAKQLWADHLTTRRKPLWLWDHRERGRIVTMHERDFGGLQKHVSAADRVLARDFELLGVRRQLTPRIEWLQGPIEWTHVLSRHAYWDDLGKAWWATGDERYPADFSAMLKDWIQSNPVPAKVSNDRGKHGSVWRTLEAGIRAQSWFGTMQLFMDAPAFDAEAKYLMSRSLAEHARYLAAWTTNYRNGNWQVCEASGLATIGIMLPEFKESGDWRQRGLSILAEHLRRDVGDDGLHWELTPSYHIWVMMEFLHVSRLCSINGIESPLPAGRHEGMFEALMKWIRPDGSYPPVGDAGMGDRTARDSLGLGALVYPRPEFRFFGPERPAESWLWYLGPEAMSRYRSLPAAKPDFTSALLPDAGYAVMRSGWDKEDLWMMFDAAPWRGGHSHQDRLQVTLFTGRDLLPDSGMISYDSPASPPLRKSAAHNVLVIDGGEQIQTDPVLDIWFTSKDLDFASATVSKDGFSHRRSVLFVKSGYAIVHDHVCGTGEHEVTRLFQLPPGGVNPGGASVSTRFNHGFNLQIECPDGAMLEMRAGTIGESITRVATNPVAAFTLKTRLPVTLQAGLFPHAVGKPVPSIRKLAGGRPDDSKLLVAFPDGGKDAILIASQPRELELAGRRAHGAAMWVRRANGRESTVVVPWKVAQGSMPHRMPPEKDKR